MARRTRQISLKECYDILGLQKGADLQAVKTAYRRRAFELHPDLHPGDPEAARQFQRLNEAYVALSAMLKPAAEGRQKESSGSRQTEKSAGSEKSSEAEKESTTENAHSSEKPGADASRAQQAYAEQDVLRDLLNDPFARRVFEDIYSELARKQESAPPPPPHNDNPPQNEKKPEAKPFRQAREPLQAKTLPLVDKNQEKGVKGVVKGWLRKQLDDEQTLTMPAAALYPGRVIRLQIRPGLSEEVNAVDVTLPRDFVAGKPLRLRGLGKRVGPWQGDLYLTINPQ